MTRNGSKAALLACAASFIFASAAHAQQSADSPDSAEEQTAPFDDSEIIVTAQKRAESVRDVPLAISAFGSETLKQSQTVDIFDLPRLAPSLRVELGFRTDTTRLNMRGVGSSGGTAVEPSVASFVDGVYLPREAMTRTAFFDLEAVEVLRGPQGTLFGRNASVGALSFRSALPTSNYEGSLVAEYGTGERYKLEGVVNLPISDNFGIRLAGQGEIFNGFYINRYDGNRVGGADTFNSRATADWQVSDAVRNITRVSYSHRNGNGAYQIYELMPDSFPAGTFNQYVARMASIGSTIDLNPFDRFVNGFSGDRMSDDQFGITNQLGWDIGSGYELKLISGYRRWKSDTLSTTHFSAQVPTFFQASQIESKSHSEELQLVSPSDLLSNHLSFVGGLYYFREDYEAGQQYTLQRDYCTLLFPTGTTNAQCLASAGNQAGSIRFDQTTSSIAAYGQATVHVVPTLDLTLGARWTSDKKDSLTVQKADYAIGSRFFGSENAALSIDDSRVTYRTNLTWRPSDNVMWFASYSTGFKSGGFNSTASGTPLNSARILKPETVNSAETGVRTTWLDRKLQFDVVAYQMNIHNFQDRSYNGIGFSVVNAGDIRSRGIETDFVVRPTDNLRLNANVAYLDSVFTDYSAASNLPGLPGVQNLTGKRPTFAPKWTGSIGADLNGDIGGGVSWLLHGDLAFTSSSNISQVNDNNPQTVQAGYALLGARFTVYGPDRRWSAAIFGQNLTDRHYCTGLGYQASGASLGVIANGESLLRCNTVAPPRTIGASFGFNF